MPVTSPPWAASATPTASSDGWAGSRSSPGRDVGAHARPRVGVGVLEQPGERVVAALGDHAERPAQAVLRVGVDGEHPPAVLGARAPRTAASDAAVDVLPTPPLEEHTASLMGGSVPPR